MSELMFENDLITQQDVDLNMYVDSTESVPDPQVIMQQAIASVHDALRKLRIIFGAEWQDVEVFLQTMEPDLDLTIDELWRRVDCDVYSLYLKGELSNYFYERWCDDLKNWENAMIEVAKRYEKWKRCSLVSSFQIKKNSNGNGQNHYENVKEEVLL